VHHVSIWIARFHAQNVENHTYIPNALFEHFQFLSKPESDMVGLYVMKKFEMALQLIALDLIELEKVWKFGLNMQ